MKYIILTIFLIFFLLYPCKNYYKSSSGIYYTSRDAKTSEIINTLRDISYSVIYDIPEKDAKILERSLQFTSFKELNGDKPTILAWNVDKGREIAVRIYDINGKPFSADEIIRALLHELAHTLAKNNGHGYGFKIKNELLQKLRSKYVKTLINNTFIDK